MAENDFTVVHYCILSILEFYNYYLILMQKINSVVPRSLLLIPNVDLVSAVIDVIKPANFIGRWIADLQPFQMYGELTLHKTWT